jgi:hypothetical protein
VEEEKNLFGQVNTKDDRSAICIGVQYTLPMLLKADARVDHTGRLRVQLGREDMALSKRLRFNFYLNTDNEYMTGFRYISYKILFPFCALRQRYGLGWWTGDNLLSFWPKSNLPGSV